MSGALVQTWTTGFATRVGDGPIVNATKQHDRWHFAWKGGSAVLELDEHEAHIKAEQAAWLLAEVEPLRAQYEQLLDQLGHAIKDSDTNDSEGEAA